MFLHSHITTLKYRPCEHQNCNLQCKMQWIFPTLGLAEERQEQEVQQEGGVVCGHGAGQGAGRPRDQRTWGSLIQGSCAGRHPASLECKCYI